MSQAVRSNTTPKPSLPKALPPAARAKVEQAIEAHSAARDALIAFLDQADGDVEDHDEEIDQDVVDEPHDPGDDDEHTWPESHGRGGIGGGAGSGTDDDEVSLGWQNNLMNQDKALKNCTGFFSTPDGSWASRASGLEAEHDGRKPDTDLEPEPEIGVNCGLRT